MGEQMRRRGLVLGIAILATLLLGVSVAADPAISVSATRRDGNGAVIPVSPTTDAQGALMPPHVLLGEYVIASGQGFPANQAVQVSLVIQNLAYPLAYHGPLASVTPAQPPSPPMTDATGAFRNLAFAIPVIGNLSGTDGEIFVSVGPATARTPIHIAAGATAGRGDTFAVSIGAAFLVVVIALILLLVRGLPVYPIGQTMARRTR